ncbi:unnamed protein product [Penicillium salamii]|nr:unnamed protein product [Penicillium salamii]CAG8367145.1 unnamed protein product [Penicillium salamii]
MGIMRPPNGASRVPKVESPSPSASDTEIMPVVAHIPFELPAPRPSGSPEMERSLANLSTDMKSLMKKIQDLSHLGIEDQQIALPKICVVGDQSTGKSSLIEAISEIRVPRAEGTCTRCPLEINLTQSDDPWKCAVYLCHRYMYVPPKGTTKVQKKKSLGPWEKMKDQDHHQFAELMDKNEITKVIFCAQLAILNPSVNPNIFSPDQDPQSSHGVQVKFSPNAVRLDISGPGYPNLSFYNLPGVINQAEQDSEKYLVSLVENLVKKYVEQDNSIVLLTLPMTDDATNSSAARLVRDIQGATGRTLGVLTKPDLRATRAFGPWEEILQDVNFKLGHGYYVVHNSANPSTSHDKARMEETDFFAKDPWSTRLAALEGRFGVKNLVAALSDLLKNQIIGCLPSILAKIDQKLKTIDESLARLPNPPTEEAQITLFEKITDLKKRIHDFFDESSPMKWRQPKQDNKPLHEQWNLIVMDLQMALRQTRPVLEICAPKDKEDLSEPADSDGEVFIIEARSSPGKKRKMATQSPDDDVDVKVPLQQLQSPYETTYFAGHRPARFTLQYLSDLRNGSQMLGVPNQLDPRAIVKLNKKTVEHWQDLLVTFLEASHGLVRKLLLEVLEDEFMEYHQTALYQKLHRILETYLQKIRLAHLQTSKEWCKSEMKVPFTMAKELQHTFMAKALKDLQARRAYSRASTYLHSRGDDMSDAKAPVKIKKIIDEDQLGPDRYSEEIKMMASSHAYYDIASSRFLDVLCQSTIVKLFDTCKDDLVGVIRDNLRIFGDDGRIRCLELMTEDPARQQRRTCLQKEREKMVTAQQELESLHRPDVAMGDDVDPWNQER